MAIAVARQNEPIGQGAFTYDHVDYALNIADPEEQASALLELADSMDLSYHIGGIVTLLDQERCPLVLTQAVLEVLRVTGIASGAYARKVVMYSDNADADVRYLACAAIAAMGPGAQHVAPNLFPRLTDDNEAVRLVACTALGEIQGCQASTMLDKLKDDSPEVRGAACIALAQLEASSENAERVAELLSEPRSRVGALQALGLMGDAASEHLEAICDCIGDMESSVRETAVEVIAKLAKKVSKNEEAMNKISLYLCDQDGSLRCAAAMACAKLGKEALEQAGTLQDMVREPYAGRAVTPQVLGGAEPKELPEWRKTECAAAVALSYMGNEEAETNGRLMVGMLESEDWEVRHCACVCLARMGDDCRDQASAVAELFEDAHYLVRAAAARCAGVFKDEDTLDALIPLMDDTSAAVRQAAVTAVGDFGEAGGDQIENIYAKFEDDADNVRAAAVRAVATMAEKGKAYVACVAAKVKPRESPMVRAAALEALGIMEESGTAYIEQVAACFSDRAAPVRAAAAGAMGRFRREAKPYIPQLKALVHDNEEEVSKAAQEALEALMRGRR